jgi:glutamyl-tRNA synthetase
LHIGGARTALFNWLYARRHGGTFVLRIEDTDVQRSSWEMVSGILDGLSWLGIDWDEGPEIGGPHAPYFQSERLERYRDAARTLLARGLAVEDEGAIRFKVPPGRTTFMDSVHGPIEFDNEHIESFVILRSDTHPTYHLSVVVDDIDMAITHVIRGDDHISNTPKHVLLFGALGAPPPRFAHVPLILGTDRKRLSKRHGATSVTEYQRAGYLPEAMVNYLALLGWSPGDDRQIMSIDEMAAAFALEGISGGNAVFDPDKLDWMNGQYIARLDLATLARVVHPLLASAGVDQEPIVRDEAGFHRLLELLRPRAKRLTDFVDQALPLIVDPAAYEPDAVAKHLSAPDLPGHLAALAAALREAPSFDEAQIEAAVRGTAAARGAKAGALIHATRVAMTGRTTSPGLFEVMALVGRERTLARLDRLLTFLSRSPIAQ